MVKATNLGQLEKLAQRAYNRNAALEAQINGIKPAGYSLVKQAAAEEGYLSTYCLTKDGAQVGEKINVPKDLLVQSAMLVTAHHANSPYTGAAPGDKYIDFTLASEDERFLGVKWRFMGSATSISNIPTADMMAGFSMRIGGVKASIEFQETLESEEIIWNDEAKTECKLCVAADKLVGTGKNTLAGMLNALLTEIGTSCWASVTRDMDGEGNLTSTATIGFRITTGNTGVYPPDVFIGDAEHLFVPVNDLVNVYTGGSGVEVKYGKVNAVVGTANANGLSATVDGLRLAAVTTATAGAMSAEDKAKLDGTSLATDAEVDTMLNAIFGTEEAGSNQ